MAWGHLPTNTSTNDKKEYLAYIDKDTRERAEEDTFVASASEVLLEKALELMDALEKNNLTTNSVTLEGKEYKNKAVVSVADAIVFNSETQREERLTHKDGSDAYSLKISINNNKANETLTLFAKDDISNGVELTNMVVKKWEKDNSGKAKPNYYKADDIKSVDKISPETKAIANFVMESGMLVKDDKAISELQKLAFTLNQNFNAESEKVVNGQGELVNNAYARYRNDEFGERVELRSHEDNVMVEFGKTAKGDKFIKATNFDYKDENGKFESLFINNKEDVGEYIGNAEIAKACIEYRNMDAKERNRPNVER